MTDRVSHLTARQLLWPALSALTALTALCAPLLVPPPGLAQPAGDGASSMTEAPAPSGTSARPTPPARRRRAPRVRADAGTAPGGAAQDTPGTTPTPVAGRGTPAADTSPAATSETGRPAGSAAPTAPAGEAGAGGMAATTPGTGGNAVDGTPPSSAAGTPPSTEGAPPSTTPAADPLAQPRAATDGPEGARAPGANLSDAGVPMPPPDAGIATDAGVPSLDGGAPAVVPASELDAGPTAAVAATEDPPALAPAAPAAPPTTTVVQVPMPFIQASESSDPWAGLREIIPGIPTGGVRPAGLLALLALLALFSSFIDRLRGRLLRDGLLPTLLSIGQVSVRLVGLLIALALIVQVVPANIRWVVYFILMASGAALGWSMRDVMPDLIAGIVIVFERRIRRGIWIRSEAFSGAVERVGLRTSWLRDSKGHRVAVPNRLLMQAPVVSDEEGDRVQEVVVRLGGANATDIRRALRDAVLSSPWTTPASEPQVLRDPMDPDLWQVRGRLLSASFASSFQGQLLERAEAQLAAQRSALVRGPDATPTDEVVSGTPTAKHGKLDKPDKPDKNGDKPDKNGDKPKAT